MATNLLLITGGSCGIGRATIETFLAHGWESINLSRQPCTLPKVKSIECDLTTTDWEQQLNFESMLTGYAKIAIVHNAACCFNDTVKDVPADQLRRAFELNVVAPSKLNQLVLPYLTSGSAIIYVGSTLSEKAVANAASYITTKHAIAGLMKATCQDFAGTAIHTACVCPGITDTEMLRQRVNHNPDSIQQLASIQTANRLISPGEIAEVIYFCATHPVMNGAIVHSNLGQRES